MARVVHLVLCLVLAVLAHAVTPRVPRMSAAEAERICEVMEIAPHSIASCVNPGRVDEVVRAFKEKTGFTEATLPLNPVILMPGLGASGLQAALDKIDYFASNNTYANQTGVSIRPNDFGGLNGVNYLDHFDDPLHITAIYATMIAALEEIGYKAGVTLYGAPYDWRLPVDYMFHETNWDENLKGLVQQAYLNAGNKKVWLVTHSMGGPTALYFMNSMGATWVSAYIEGFIPIAGPWSGSPDALRAQVEGTNFGLQLGSISIINMNHIANIARQSGGISYLLPDEYYWPEDQVFVSTPSVNYTMKDIAQLFTDLGTPITEEIHQETYQLMDKMAPPTVPTYCLYGYNISTLISLSYPVDFAGHGSNYIPPAGGRDMSNLGDGTVPLQSLQECKSWLAQGADINCKEYNLKKHSAIIKDVDVLSDVLAIVSGKPTFSGCTTTVLDSIKSIRKQ